MGQACERMRVAESYKETAGRYFKTGRHGWAICCYGNAAQTAILITTQAKTESQKDPDSM